MQAAITHRDDPLPSAHWREGGLLLLAFAFLIVNAVSLALVRDGAVALRDLAIPGLWALFIGPACVVLIKLKPAHDPYLLPIFGLLSGWGLLLQDRLAPNFVGRQMVWFALGSVVVTALAVLPVPWHLLRRYPYTLLLAGIGLLAATLLFGINPSGFGAALWLPVPLIGSVYFQPSELLKLLIILFFAAYFAERGLVAAVARHTDRPLSTVRTLAPLALMWGFCIVLLVWQRDLGAATLFFILFLSMLYAATGSRRAVLVGLGLLLAAGVAGYFLFGVVALRVDAWWNPWPDADDRAFQIVQSLYAIVAGGVLGQGIGQGFPVYIPVVHSDFAFAAIAEEWGLIGSLVVTGAFVVLAYRGIGIARAQRQPYLGYVATGLTVMLCAQAFLIMAGVVKLLPLTGVTLPFVSYGGSSFLLSSAMVGLLLCLSAETPPPRIR